MKIKNILAIGITLSTLSASEVEYGKGTMELKGGFIGLNNTISADITTYSMIENHKNFGNNWYYRYNLTWYDSKDMVNAQNSINSTSGLLGSSTTYTTPTIDYRLQGLDINIAIGKDINHIDENNYLGVGILIGASIPWIDSKKDDDNDDDSSSDTMDNMEDSKTKFYTYKIGPTISGRYGLNSLFSLYGSLSYAFQTATIKNDYAKTDMSVNGNFFEYDFGIRFQPVAFDKKVGPITISPRLYATLGYRFSKWTFKDVSIDVTGNELTFLANDLEINSKITYFGIGYSF